MKKDSLYSPGSIWTCKVQCLFSLFMQGVMLLILFSTSHVYILTTY